MYVYKIVPNRSFVIKEWHIYDANIVVLYVRRKMSLKKT